MILCGTDLSLASEPALKAAGALAKKQGRELLLAHVLERDDSAARSSAELQLEQEAAELRRELGVSVETVVVTGVTTHVCVESTVRDAFLRDYYAVVVEDAVAARDADSHGAALRAMNDYFAEVAPAATVIAAWESATASQAVRSVSAGTTSPK